MPPQAAEYTVARTYLDWLIQLPWSKSRPRTSSTSSRRRSILDEDHYDLEKVKDRILEYLAVRSLKNDLKGPDPLLLAGPPGVGKTSLGKSIARAMGRKFVRACRSAASVTRRRFAVTGGPTSARSPVASSRASRRQGRTTRSSCSTRSTRSAPTSAATPRRRLLEVLDPEQNDSFSGSLPRGPVGSDQRLLHQHRQRARHDSGARCATGWKC